MLSGITPNLQCKILTHGVLGHSHHTNLHRGLLDGGISIPGTSFLNQLHLNSHHILLNILNFLNIPNIHLSSCSYRIILFLIYQYDLNCLPNPILTRIIRQSINWRLSTCQPTLFPLYLVTIFSYDLGK